MLRSFDVNKVSFMKFIILFSYHTSFDSRESNNYTRSHLLEMGSALGALKNNE